jgi:hypothetical protein
VGVYRSLQSVSGVGLTIFALACAERGSGIFGNLADEQDREWFYRILELAWDVPVGEADENELVEVVEEFQERAESLDPDEPDSKDFYALQSAMLAVNTIAVHLNPSPMRTETSGQTLETLLGDFDFRLSGQRAVIVRSGEAELPVGRLQQMEQTAQSATLQAVVTLTDQDRVTREFLDNIREICRPVRDEIAAGTVSVAELAGWETHST